MELVFISKEHKAFKLLKPHSARSAYFIIWGVAVPFHAFRDAGWIIPLSHRASAEKSNSFHHRNKEEAFSSKTFVLVAWWTLKSNWCKIEMLCLSCVPLHFRAYPKHSYWNQLEASRSTGESLSRPLATILALSNMYRNDLKEF